MLLGNFFNSLYFNNVSNKYTHPSFVIYSKQTLPFCYALFWNNGDWLRFIVIIIIDWSQGNIIFLIYWVRFREIKIQLFVLAIVPIDFFLIYVFIFVFIFYVFSCVKFICIYLLTPKYLWNAHTFIQITCNLFNNFQDHNYWLAKCFRN